MLNYVVVVVVGVVAAVVAVVVLVVVVADIVVVSVEIFCNANNCFHEMAQIWVHRMSHGKKGYVVHLMILLSLKSKFFETVFIKWHKFG